MTSIAGKSNRIGQDGFTLFELLVVIAILAIGAGLLVPILDIDVGGGGIGKAVRSVESALNQGRTLARMQRDDVIIRFQPDSVSIGTDGERMTFSGGVRFESIRFPDGVLDTGNGLRVDRRGIVQASIVIMTVDDQKYSLLLSPVLREVEYRTGQADFEDFAD